MQVRMLPDAHGPAWDWVPALPTELLERISATMTAADMAAALSVNAAWQAAFGRAVLELRPRSSTPNQAVRLAALFPELQRLLLDDCVGVSIRDEQAHEACMLPHLAVLSLLGCKALTDAGLAGLSSLTGAPPALPAFWSFDLLLHAPSHDHARGPAGQLRTEMHLQISFRVCAVCLPAGLRELSLSKCERLSGRVLGHLRGAPRLASLDLRHCAWLRDCDVPALGALPSLRLLSLADCKGITCAGAALAFASTQGVANLC
jgi:hypothetical protein